MVTNRNLEITGQFTTLTERISKVAIQAERRPEDIELIAVTKTFTAEAILPVLKLGHRVFGENRVQEAAGKWPELRNRFAGIKLHLIGPLQTNKTASAVSLFDCVETLDRKKLAKAIAAEQGKQNKQIELFIQVNTGAEPQKAGVLIDDLPGFVIFCRQELGLHVSGLMCIPPVGENPQKHFSQLKNLAKENSLNKLSMGMSSDFAAAINCGATHVRIGTAIFGNR